MISPLLSDSALRDGVQGGLIFDSEDYVSYYDLLSSINEIRPLITEMEVYCYNADHRKSVERLNERFFASASIRPVVWMGVHGAMNMMPYLPLRTAVGLDLSRSVVRGEEDDLNKVKQILGCLQEKDSPIQLHFEQVGQCDMEMIASFLEKLRPIIPHEQQRIQLSDTYGLCVPYDDSQPYSVPQIIRFFDSSGYAKDQLTFHFHNDRGMAVANAFAALERGCARLDGAFGGAGERGGLPSLEILLLSFFQDQPDMETELLTRTKNIIDFLIQRGLDVAPQMPFWGRVTNAMSAGKLAGVAKRRGRLPKDYEALVTLDTEEDGIAFLLRKNMNIDCEKTDPFVGRLWRQIRDELLQTRKSKTEKEFIELATSFLRFDEDSSRLRACS